MAEKMMNDSILEFCFNNGRGCNLINSNSAFRIIEFRRIENRVVFGRHKQYEAHMSEYLRQQETAPVEEGNISEWLKRLSRRNGLCSSANTTYLLHGTSSEILDSIAQNGLKTRFSLSTSPRYGRGLYFTDSSCKAHQFAMSGCTILVCRVVLGRTQVLPASDPNRLFPTAGFHSAMAKRNVTASPYPNFQHQLHNEYIVLDERACYPEFVLSYELS